MGRLDDKVVIITGGASGIGKASVRLFIEEGARVIFGDIQDERGKALAEELGSNAIYLHTNVRIESEIKAAIDFTVEKFGRLDVMFNNAGFGGATGPIEEIPTDAFDVTMEVMFRSVFLGMKNAIPVMKKQGSGCIISTASVAGLRTGMAPHVYSAAKAAIIHLTRTVAEEVGEHNIRVNSICPGGIATPIFGKGIGLPQDKAERLAVLAKLFLNEIQPIKRAGLPEDIAKAALWLASDDSNFVSGHALVVDGGLIWRRILDQDAERLEEFAQRLGIESIEERMRQINDEIAKMK
ncbi:MAG: glucose 1-dehydrogenase [Promethearchaeota archaeon]|nr:MAG: glucose 1-dehydrogenase [Candidatus Lokiarchaeota archaeon]